MDYVVLFLAPFFFFAFLMARLTRRKLWGFLYLVLAPVLSGFLWFQFLESGSLAERAFIHLFGKGNPNHGDQLGRAVVALLLAIGIGCIGPFLLAVPLALSKRSAKGGPATRGDHAEIRPE